MTVMLACAMYTMWTTAHLLLYQTLTGWFLAAWQHQHTLTCRKRTTPLCPILLLHWSVQGDGPNAMGAIKNLFGFDMINYSI